MDDGMAQRREQVFVQALLPHPSVAAFHKAVLHGFSGRYVVPADLSIFLPFQHCGAGLFGPVVRDHKAGIHGTNWIFDRSALGSYPSVYYQLRQAFE